MTQEWDDILAEPMAQLQPDLPAAQGGWRAVRSIDEVSPRPQQPPLTLPGPDGMLSVRLPAQPEEATPSSAPPPPSLTDQLSLTWANRKMGRRRIAEEAAGENWPAWEPSQETGPQLQMPASRVLSWLRPLRGLIRLFQPKAVDDADLQETPRATPVMVEVTPPPSRRAAPPDVPPGAPAARSTTGPTLDDETGVPLTLAERPVPTPSADQPEVLATTYESATARPVAPADTESVDVAAPKLQDNVLRRWLARRRTDEAMPKEPGPNDAERSGPMAGFRPVPFVDRERHQVTESPTNTPEAQSTIPEEAAARREEGSPLPPLLRARMEKLLDVPLKEVRVFRNSIAHRAADAHGAEALAIGHEIHMAQGRGDSSTPSGQALMAHELSHVASSIGGKRESEHQEERRAQAVEYTLKSQPDLAVARHPPTASPTLAHRSPPRAISAPPTNPARPISDSGGGFAGGGASGSLPSSSATVHRAPVGRIPAIADSALSSGSGGSMSSADEPADSHEPASDEPGGVDRIVEAVMRRLRREGTFERERRGSFRSEIGG